MMEKQVAKKKLPGWKKRSFRFYFILFTVITVFVAVGVESTLSAILTKYLPAKFRIPTFILTGVLGLIIGTVLSFFIGKFLLSPVKNLQTAMKAVTAGDLAAAVSEESIFEEITSINHSFNLMIGELRSSEQMQRDFVSNVSHEFKTPLSVLEGYAQLLQDPLLTSEDREIYIQKIIDTTHKMNELIGNILLLSRLDHQRLEPVKKRYDLAEQVRTTVAELQKKWESKNLSFDAVLEEVFILQNEMLLSHILVNLIDNAIKFSPENGTVTLTLKRADNTAVFTVTDEGEGIQPHAEERIFQPFYQADTSRKAEGNGLGLALVKRVLDKTGGSISAKNTPQGGACFSIVLPID